RITSAATDDMPERIWYHPDGAYLSCQPTMHWEWQEYIRADLCASGQQVRALDDASEYLAREYEFFGYPTYADLARRKAGEFTLCSIRAIEKAQADAVKSALTPAQQPGGQIMDGWVDDKTFIEPVSPTATPTAQEAVPSALRYVPTVTTDNCRTLPQPSE